MLLTLFASGCLHICLASKLHFPRWDEIAQEVYLCHTRDGNWSDEYGIDVRP